jgi:tRNA(Ile)-lysidine synthase
VNVIETIRRTIDRHGLIPDGATVVVAVSGGADSVALLRALHAMDLPLTVAHLNHQLRGEASDADEAFVRGLASELGLPVAVQSADVHALAESESLSIEMAARRARHAFFAEFGDAAIALAHHADDQVETFLLRMARGAGTEGLCGMPYVQQLDSMRLIRPLLDLHRFDILAWLREGGYAWREDATNSDETFLRNRVRHSILPMLERELNPNIRETILRSMDVLREEDAWMNGMVADTGMDAMTTLPKAAQRRVLRAWLFEQGAADADYDRVEKLLELMNKGNGSTVFDLNDRQRVVVEYGRPRMEERNNPAAGPIWTLHVDPGQGWKKDHGKGPGMLPAEASFNAEKVGDSPLEVRAAGPGDRIEPLGMKGSRKLQDILTDLKVPKAQRTRIPVVVCRDTIIWVPGYRIARDWEVGNQHEKSIHVRIEQKPAD